MTFEEYLASKKIDSVAFRAAEPDRWNEWNSLLGVMNPASFTSQKLYLINPVRRKYPLKQVLQVSDAKKDTAAPKPVMRPKPKMN
jgi:hypothetical protein